jgi:hypothetical protein
MLAMFMSALQSVLSLSEAFAVIRELVDNHLAPGRHQSISAYSGGCVVIHQRPTTAYAPQRCSRVHVACACTREHLALHSLSTFHIWQEHCKYTGTYIHLHMKQAP